MRRTFPPHSLILKRKKSSSAGTAIRQCHLWFKYIWYEFLNVIITESRGDMGMTSNSVLAQSSSYSSPLLSPLSPCRGALSDVWRWLLWWPPGTIWGSSTVCEMRLQWQRGLQRVGNMWPHHWAMFEMPETHRGRALPTLPAGFLRRCPEPDSRPEVQAWVTEKGVRWNISQLIHYLLREMEKERYCIPVRLCPHPLNKCAYFTCMFDIHCLNDVCAKFDTEGCLHIHLLKGKFICAHFKSDIKRVHEAWQCDITISLEANHGPMCNLQVWCGSLKPPVHLPRPGVWTMFAYSYITILQWGIRSRCHFKNFQHCNWTILEGKTVFVILFFNLKTCFGGIFTNPWVLTQDTYDMPSVCLLGFRLFTSPQNW